jgi:hypothetical protein
MARRGPSVGRQTPCYRPPVPPYVQSMGGVGLLPYVLTLYLKLRLERTETGNVQCCSVSRLLCNTPSCVAVHDLKTKIYRENKKI